MSDVVGPPFCREAGNGEAVICLHSNASASAQWKSLMETLSSQYHVIAPDSLGAGKSPAWPTDRTITLLDEVALLEPIIESVKHPFNLVGHSYGGAVALCTALKYPNAVRAIAVYEPTLFSLAKQCPEERDAVKGISDTASDAARAVTEGNLSKAAQIFIDYWMGAEIWHTMPPARQELIAASMVNIQGWSHVLLNDTTPLSEFSKLDVPVLYMTGGRSPASATAVANVLRPALKRATHIEFASLGHMAPLTAPEPINAAIAEFFSSHVK